MMPLTFMRGQLAEKCRMLTPYAHEGEKYEQLGLAIAEELSLPHFRVRARMIQMGHVHAKGALNYVDRHRIRPYSFDEASSARMSIPSISAGSQREVCMKRTRISENCWTVENMSMPMGILCATIHVLQNRLPMAMC